MDAAFAFRCPVEAVIVAKPQVFISAPVLGRDDVAGVHIPDSQHFFSRRCSFASVSLVGIKRNPAVGREIDFCPAVEDIVEARVVSAEADCAHVADRDSESAAEGNH